MSDRGDEYRKSIAQWKRYNANRGWIGVDLDGTLAKHGEWKGPLHIGEPVPAMADRVNKWLALGLDVRIFTARASSGDQAVIEAIGAWCETHLGRRLPVTCQKDYQMIELWDDRAVQVVPNEGARADGKADACCYDGECPLCRDNG